MSPPLSTRGRSADRQCFARNAWCARAQLRYFVRHMLLRLAEVVRRSCRRQVHILHIYMMILVFEGTRIWSGVFFVSASVWDSRNWNFSVKSICSSAVFGGRLQRPSPCLIRSAPGRERGQTPSETSEKCARTTRFERYSPVILRISMYGEVDKINLGKKTFPNWRHNQSQNKEYLLKKNPHGTAVGIIVVHLFVEFRLHVRTYMDRWGTRTHDLNEDEMITITTPEKTTH